MKKMLILFAALLFPIVSYAAMENPNDIQGTLRQVYSDHITINYTSPTSSSSDSNIVAGGERTVWVDSETQYRNFNQLGDLKEGDPINIEFRLDMNREKHPGVTKELASIITKLDSNSTKTTVVTTTRTTTTEDTNP